MGAVEYFAKDWIPRHSAPKFRVNTLLDNYIHHLVHSLALINPIRRLWGILLLFLIAGSAIAGTPLCPPTPKSKADKKGTEAVPSPTPDYCRDERKAGWLDRAAVIDRNRFDFKQQAATVTHRVADLRKRLEEWGSVTVSAPLVMREVGEFGLGDEPAFPNTLQYINLALSSAQGGVSQSTATAFSNQLDLTVTPTFSINPLTGAKMERPDTNSSLTPDSVANGTSITLTDFLAPGVAGGKAGQFAAPGSLIVGPNGQTALKAGANGTALTPSSNFVLSGSQAAVIGTNAKLTERLMRTMADPPQQLFTNPEYQIHFAIVQVSCNPGWRTKENYIADVSATCHYFHANESRDADGNLVKNPGGKVVDVAGKNPRVFSVLPLLDAQTLELQNSERRLTSLAASLSAAFPTAAANLKGRDLIQFVKQFQKDTQTVTPRTVANSYSSGATFGFRLAPSLTALKDPARSGSKPANILQATSFPVLVTIVVSSQDLVDLGANAVKVSIANRWLVNDHPPLKEVWRRIGLPLWPERTGARLDLAMAWGEANRDLGCLQRYADEHDEYLEATATLERDLQELRAKLVGVDNPVFCFPSCPDKRRKSEVSSAKSPLIQQIVPASIVAKGDVSLFISGQNFFCDDVQAKRPYTPAHPYTLATAQVDPLINVWLGQIKGTVLMCNGDDQLVVKFSGLDALSTQQAASLVIQTSYGAGALGNAVTATGAPADKATQLTVKDIDTTDVSVNGDGSFTIIVSGSSLDNVKGAKLLSDALPDLGKNAKLDTLLRNDGSLLLLSFSKVPVSALEHNVILELDDTTGDNAKSLKNLPVVLPPLNNPTLPAPFTISGDPQHTDPVANAKNKDAYDMTVYVTGTGLEIVGKAKLSDSNGSFGKDDTGKAKEVTSDVALHKQGSKLLVSFSALPASALQGQKVTLTLIDRSGPPLTPTATVTMPGKP